MKTIHRVRTLCIVPPGLGDSSASQSNRFDPNFHEGVAVGASVERQMACRTPDTMCQMSIPPAVLHPEAEGDGQQMPERSLRLVPRYMNGHLVETRHLGYGDTRCGKESQD